MFTKTTKRVISLILCMLMLVPFATIMAGAYVDDPYSDERKKARDLYKTEKCGEVTYLGKTYTTEIKVYSPMKEASSREYPVVFMIGKEDADMALDSFAFWAKEEYQQKFYKTKGAYIVYVKLAAKKPIDSFNLMMDEFIDAYESNVDKSRLYLVAWDVGCETAIKLTTAKNNRFAALVLSSPRNLITEFPQKTPTWLFASKNEISSINYNLTQCWGNLKDNTSVAKSDIRFTSFDSFNTRGEQNHETWEYVAYDISKYTGPVSGAKTVNGRDEKVEADSVIEWMSRFGSDYGKDCDCPCHGTDDMVEKILWFFKWMLSMMLKIEKNRPCKCGVVDHW